MSRSKGAKCVPNELCKKIKACTALEYVYVIFLGENLRCHLLIEVSREQSPRKLFYATFEWQPWILFECTSVRKRLFVDRKFCSAA